MAETVPNLSRGLGPLLWRAKWHLLAGALLSGGVAAAVVWARPPEYRATSVYVLPLSGGSAASAIAAALPGLSRESSPLSILYGVAASDEAYRMVEQRTGRPFLELRERLRWDMDSATNQVSVSATYSQKARALAVCQTASSVMRTLSARLTGTLAQENLSQLEPTVRQREQELRQAEDQLLAYAQRLQTAPDPAQPLSAGAYVQRLKDVEIELGRTERQLELARRNAIRRGEPANVANVPTGPNGANPSWKARVTEAEVALRLAETRYGPRAPEVELARRTLTITRQEAATQAARYVQAVRGGLDPEVAQLEGQRQVLAYTRDRLAGLAKVAPEEAVELSRLAREVQGRTEIVAQVRRQAEEARLQAQTQAIPFTLLQEPTLDPEPTNKSPLKTVGVSALMGLLVGAACVALFGKRI